MIKLMSCAALLALLAAPAAAETQYDRKIEQAVKEIIAKKKLAEMRGGFDFDQKPEIVVIQDVLITGSINSDLASMVTETTMTPADTERSFGPFAPAGPRSGFERRISRVITF